MAPRSFIRLRFVYIRIFIILLRIVYVLQFATTILIDYTNYIRAGIFAAIILVGIWGNYKDKKQMERMEKHHKRYDI